jgi:hypothetical protein
LTLEIPPSHSPNLHLLSQISNTYEWLERHIEDTDLGNQIVQHHAEALFLNVDDPEKMDWVWRCADQLYFNITDSPASGYWGVCQFLLPFRGLLRLAGVAEVVMPAAPDRQISSTEEKLHQATLMRNAFNEMRHEGKLTDVVFVTDDYEEYPAHRVVLAAGGEHFQDLFLGGWEESNDTVNGQIHVPDCSANSLEWILGESTIVSWKFVFG